MIEPTFEELDRLGFDLWSRAPRNTRDIWSAMDEGERSYWRSIAKLAWPLRIQNAELVAALSKARRHIGLLSEHPAYRMSEAGLRQIDAALAGAGQSQGSGK